MPLDVKLGQRLQHALRLIEEPGTAGPRLLDDAHRLWWRIGRFVEMKLVSDGLDLDALELATHALQLPLRRSRTLATGKPARATLRDRAEESAELLVGLIGEQAEERLLDRATRILHEMPHRSPILDEAKLLADAVNLDDFGVTGLVSQVIQLARQGEGMLQFADGCQKRDLYGYWEARLRDGFHFDAVKQLARARLENARRIAEVLLQELRDDGVKL